MKLVQEKFDKDVEKIKLDYDQKLANEVKVQQELKEKYDNASEADKQEIRKIMDQNIKDQAEKI